MEEENIPQPPLPEQPVVPPTSELHPEPAHSEPAESVEGPQEPKTDYLKIGLLVLAGLVLLGGAGCAGYWYANESVKRKAQSVKPQLKTQNLTPTPSVEEQTKDWKTYRNEEYGFKISFPKSWSVNEDSYAFKEGGDLLSIYIWGETQKTDTELYDGASLTIGSVIKTDKDIQSWAKEYYGERNPVYDTPFEFSQETINGLVFQKVFNSANRYLTYYHIKRADYIYRIVTTATGPREGEYRQTLNQILSTFQFTD